jgi:fatty-acyl-CoA synthase
MEGDAAAGTIGQLLQARAAQHPQRPFLVIDDKELDFGAVYAAAMRLARGMAALGLARGDHVAILMPNSIEAALVFFATHLAGAVAVPINARFKRRELRHVIAHSDARFLFTTQAVREHVDFVSLVWDSLESLATAGPGKLSLAEAPELRHVVVSGGKAPLPALTWEAVEQASDRIAEPKFAARVAHSTDDEVAYLLYTSGTTTLPKGCELTHRAMMTSWRHFAEAVGLTTHGGFWSPCPFFHLAGLGPMTASLVVGTSFLSMTHFDPEGAIAMIERHRPRHLFPAFPALTLALLRSSTFDKQRLGFLETVLNVAPPETQRLIQSLLPETTRLLNNFGMTESSGSITLTRPEDDEAQRLGSNGRALPGLEVRIVDPVGRATLSADSDGEIHFRGINALRAYYKDPEATALTINPDGWVATGDIGRFDEHGNLHFIGRLKDMLKVGGENVAPAEIEAHLSTHPAVKMVQVVGKADAKYGEVPIAFVELLDDHSVPPEALIEHCRGQLASFKIPRSVRFVTEWPMSSTKIQKFRLRELLDAELPDPVGLEGGTRG